MPRQPQPAVLAGETLAYVLRRKLADEILGGQIRPGARLDEQSLATRFGVSRTPIREALKQLDSSGLVHHRPHRGAVVLELDEDLTAELFEAAGELEALCARLAAVRMTLGQHKALREIVRQGAACVRRRDAEDYATLNRQFHVAIVEGARNRSLARAADLVRVQAGPFRKAQFSMTNRMPSSQREHGIIVRAIERQDGEAAYTAMKEHIAASCANILGSLTKIRECA